MPINNRNYKPSKSLNLLRDLYDKIRVSGELKLKAIADKSVVRITLLLLVFSLTALIFIVVVWPYKGEKATIVSTILANFGNWMMGIGVIVGTIYTVYEFIQRKRSEVTEKIIPNIYDLYEIIISNYWSIKHIDEIKPQLQGVRNIYLGNQNLLDEKFKEQVKNVIKDGSNYLKSLQEIKAIEDELIKVVQKIKHEIDLRKTQNYYRQSGTDYKPFFGLINKTLTILYDKAKKLYLKTNSNKDSFIGSCDKFLKNGDKDFEDLIYKETLTDDDLLQKVLQEHLCLLEQIYQLIHFEVNEDDNKSSVAEFAYRIFKLIELRMDKEFKFYFDKNDNFIVKTVYSTNKFSMMLENMKQLPQNEEDEEVFTQTINAFKYSSGFLCALKSKFHPEKEAEAV